MYHIILKEGYTLKIIGKYCDNKYRSLRIQKGAMVALDLSSAWTEGYSDREDETRFFIVVRSGCYMFHILSNTGKYYSKSEADELIKKIMLSEFVILDEDNMALYEAMDTTPDEFWVRNALDEEYNEIPLIVTE